MAVEYFERRSAREALEKINQPRAGSWVHVRGSISRPSSLLGVVEQFSLDANIVRDASDIHELPRAEYKNGIEYVFVRLPVGEVDAGETAPLLCIIAPARFITVSVHSTFSPLQTDVFLTTTTDKPASLLTATMASVVSMYEQRIRELSVKISGARKRLSRYEVQNADFIEFVAIEDSLNEYRGSIESLGSVVQQLRENRRQLFRSRDLESLEDILLHTRQLLVSISSNTQTISSIQNAYSTVANNTLNQRMKLLTAFTILLAIPNVFYGMYGMNIALPFQHEAWAYPFIAGFTVLLILLVLIIARRYRLF